MALFSGLSPLYGRSFLLATSHYIPAPAAGGNTGSPIGPGIFLWITYAS